MISPETLLIALEKAASKKVVAVIFAFGDLVLDCDRRELRRSGVLVAIEPQVFDVLEFLVCNHDRIVRKDDLITGVWDGRIVSDSTISSRISAVRRAIADDGRQQRLVRTLPRRGFRFIGDVRTDRNRTTRLATPVETGKAAMPAGQRPAIAVLPFAGSSTHERDWLDFVYGLTEDLTTALSQYPWLSVIARGLSCAYDGWAVDIRQIGRELDVHYVLEGSIRSVGDKKRITARLVDVRSATQIWGRRYELACSDPFELQDHVTSKIVAAIGPKLELIEIERANRLTAEQLDSVRSYLLGLGRLYEWSMEGVEDALVMFHNSADLDPDFAPAYGMAAYCYVQRKSYGWLKDRDREISQCEALARTAADLAVDDAVTLSRAAHAISTVAGDLDSGVALVERAIRINPALAGAWYVNGWLQLILGHPDVAREHLLRAIRLAPNDPLAFKVRAALAYALFFQGNFDEAAAMALGTLRTRPSYHTAMRAAAAGHALAGRVGEARTLISEMHEHNPELCLSNLSSLIPFRRRQDWNRWTEGLQLAGLPA